MVDNAWRVGIVTFTDPRDTALAQEREAYLRERHAALVSSVQGAGLIPVDPLSQMRAPGDGVFGLRTAGEVAQAARLLREGRADCLVIGCWHLTDPALPLSLVRELPVPVLLYAEDEPAWAGTVGLGAVGAALWEVGITPYALRHRRLLGDMGRIAPWARGVCALANLRRSTLLMWGGSSGSGSEHRQDDPARLRSLLVGEVLTESQHALVRLAQRIRAEQPGRVEDFIEWLQNGGAEIAWDDPALTRDALERQVAVYLAARDRLRELGDEPIAAVSVRCQPELTEEYGVAGCLLPAFLPFGHDSEGEQPVMPTACGGDVKAVLTCALLGLIQPEAPPLFGDLRYLGEESLILANCGGSSVYYAAHSHDPGEVLPRLRLAGQCQGVAGAAVGGYELRPSPVTLAGLVAVGGEHIMHLGRGTSLQMDERLKSRIIWGRMWPHAAIHLEVPRELLVRVVGSSHYCATPGDVSAEMEAACEAAGVPVLHLDSAEELSNFAKRWPR